MLLLVISLFISCILLIIFFSVKIGLNGVKGIVFLCFSFLLLYIYVLFLYFVLSGHVFLVIGWVWLKISFCFCRICFLFDRLTYTMLLIVVVISVCVIIYSIEYMAWDPHIIRFLLQLLLFTFFMIFLVVSSNLFQFFFG